MMAKNVENVHMNLLARSESRGVFELFYHVRHTPAEYWFGPNRPILAPPA